MEEQVQRVRLAMEFQILKELQGEGILKIYRLYNGHKHNSLFIY